jgi:uncharacterized protein involved in tolerance to divalent cations
MEALRCITYQSYLPYDGHVRRRNESLYLYKVQVNERNELRLQSHQQPAYQIPADIDMRGYQELQQSSFQARSNSTGWE